MYLYTKYFLWATALSTVSLNPWNNPVKSVGGAGGASDAVAVADRRASPSAGAVSRGGVHTPAGLAVSVPQCQCGVWLFLLETFS